MKAATTTTAKAIAKLNAKTNAKAKEAAMTKPTTAQAAPAKQLELVSAAPPKPVTTTPTTKPVVSVSSRPVPEKVDPVLVRILGWRRGHNSPSERAFCSMLYTYLEAKLAKHAGSAVARMSSADNIVFTLPTKDGKKPGVLFSCHVDTVDATPGAARYSLPSDKNAPSVVLTDQEIMRMGLTQRTAYDSNFGHIFLDKTDKTAGTCLGADDGVGVWIMLRMIDAGVPGAYVFHRGEECGGIGAHAMANEHKEWLKGFKLAVAFDRPAEYEVVITQGGARCASKELGTALATALNNLDNEFDYRVSERGVFTDTKVYRGIIPECINLGVGYTAQHGPGETLDYGHALALAQACVELDWGALPIVRDPGEIDVDDWGYGQYGRGYYGDDLYGKPWGKAPAPAPKPAAQAKAPAPAPKPLVSKGPELDVLDELEGMTATDLSDLCHSDPDMVANLVVMLAVELAGERAKTAQFKRFLGDN